MFLLTKRKPPNTILILSYEDVVVNIYLLNRLSFIHNRRSD